MADLPECPVRKLIGERILCGHSKVHSHLPDNEVPAALCQVCVWRTQPSEPVQTQPVEQPKGIVGRLVSGVKALFAGSDQPKSLAKKRGGCYPCRKRAERGSNKA